MAPRIIMTGVYRLQSKNNWMKAQRLVIMLFNFDQKSHLTNETDKKERGGVCKEGFTLLKSRLKDFEREF